MIACSVHLGVHGELRQEGDETGGNSVERVVRERELQLGRGNTQCILSA